jgi:folate-dependent phosphoribosylglycinamide formyltransferase PurN
MWNQVKEISNSLEEMISEKLILPLILAIESRLDQLIVQPGMRTETSPKLNPEESLRYLMVKIFPKVLRNEGLSDDVMDIFPNLFDAVARGSPLDIRYTDCLNCFYEVRLNLEKSLRNFFISIYKNRLVQQLEVLSSSQFQHIPVKKCVESTLKTLPIKYRSNLRILIIASDIFSAGRVLAPTGKILNVQIDILCVDTTQNKWQFLLKILLRGPISFLRYPQLIRALLLGRLRFESRGLNSLDVQNDIRLREYDIGIHAANMIYKKQHIDLFKLGILNSHVGLLPEYRGRSVIEWSLFGGQSTGVTIFFIDEGIDTGRYVVLQKFVNLGSCKSLVSARKLLFGMDGQSYAEAINLIQAKSAVFENNGDGRRYFVMSDFFRDLLVWNWNDIRQ